MSDVVFSDLYPVKNRVKGIIPTASGWGTPPDHLERCTDLDWDTPTGTGSTTLSAAADYGFIDFDMGAEYKVMLRAKIGIWSTANNTYLNLGVWNPATSSWQYSGYALFYWGSTTEMIAFIFVPFFKAQKFRIRFYCSGAATAYARIYEVQAIDLGLP